MAGQQAAVEQLADDARVPAGQRAAGGLDVAEPRAPAAACASAQAIGASWPCRPNTADGPAERRASAARRPRVVALLDRQHGVLQRAVVELHHVRARRRRCRRDRA